MAFNAQQTKRAQAVIVAAVLVIVVAVAAVVLSGVVAPATPEAQQTVSGQQGSSEVSSDTVSEEHDMSHVDAQYQTTVDNLRKQYDADPTNPSALLNLANGYFDWGVSALDVVQSDEDQAHVIDLFSNAISRYDDYLADNPGSKSVEVDRAIAIFYTGDTDRAIAELEEFTASDDSFGPAWANLGMFYENAGRTDDARAAYEKAVSCDPDDAFGVKTYAQQRLDALDAS